MSTRVRAFIAPFALCVIAACSETDRITATPAPRATGTAAAVLSTAPSATTRPPATTASPTASASPTPTRTSPAPSGTSAPPTSPATPTPTLPPGASLPPMPSQPALPSGVTVVSTGTVAIALGAGQSRTFEAADLMAARNATPPPNATLVWTVAWRASDPLNAAWYRQTSRTELGRGRWGTAELGGAGFELRNVGATNVIGELSYTIGSR